MLEAKQQQQQQPLRLTSLQANLISLALVLPITLVLLIVSISHRDSLVGVAVVGGLCGVALGALIFMRPQVGTYILAFTVFTNISAVLTDMDLPGVNKPLVALTFVSVISGRLMRRESMSLKPPELFLLAYGGVWLASAFGAKDRDISIEHFVDFVKEYLIVLSIIYALKKREHIKRAMWMVILATTFLASLGTYQVLTGNFGEVFWGLATVTPDVDQMRLSGPVGDPNFYSQILCAVLAMAVYRVASETKWSLRIVAILCVYFLTFTAVNTYSRGAFMALVIVYAAATIERGVNLTKLITVGLVIMFILPLITPFLPAGFQERMETLYVFTDEDASVHEDASFRGRTSEMISGALMFLDHPFLGIGVGNYEGTYQDYARLLGLEHRTEERQAHSLYVEIIAETGGFGLATFTGMMVVVFIGLYKAKQRALILDPDTDWGGWIAGLQIGLTSYLFTSIFLHGDYIRYLLFLVTIAACVIHVSDQEWEQAKFEGRLGDGYYEPKPKPAY